MKSITLFWDWIRYNEQTLKNPRNEKPAVQKMFIYCLISICIITVNSLKVY